MKFSIMVLVALLFATSALKAQTPIEFNDILVNITDSFYAKGQQWGRMFNEARKTNEFSKLEQTRLILEKFCNEKVTEVSMMKDVGGSESLRKAMINYLLFEKEMVSKAFMPLEKIPSTASPSEVDSALKKLNELAEKENEMLHLVNEAQVAYAKKHGFKIEASE